MKEIMFSKIKYTAFLMVAILVACFYYKTNITLSIANFFIGLAVFVSMQLAFLYMQGTGVLANRKKKYQSGLRFWILKTFKMPLPQFIIMSLVVLVTAKLMHFSFFDDFEGFVFAQTVKNFKAFSLSAAFSVGVSLLYWKFNWYEFFFADEYSARIELKNAGDSPEIIEIKIKKLREDGIFG